MAFVGILKTVVKTIEGRYPAASFQKLLTSNARQINTGTFDKDNILRLPEYDFSYIKVPIDLHYTENLLAPSVDVKELADDLNRKIGFTKWPYYEKLNQLDFTWAIDVYKFVYKKILEVLEKYEPTDDNLKNISPKKTHTQDKE
ncbi:hypothetical protein C0J52_24789 [Blattella germanica]|nr:hypothetical protein C0J52_24789 [Blattella germanica]